MFNGKDASRGRESRSGRIAAGGLLLVPLVGVGILLFMYVTPPNKGGKGYLETTIEAKRTARARVGEIDLYNFYKELQVYAITEDRYPSERKIIEASPIARMLLRGKGDQGPMCMYIEGQSPRDPGENVLVYEVGLEEGQKGRVLLRSGEVVRASADEIDDAVAETEQRLARR